MRGVLRYRAGIMTRGAVERAVAIDLGGTKIRAAEVGPDGTPLVAADVATPTQDPAALLAAVEEVIARCGMRMPPTVVGLGMPGVIDLATGRLTRCQNIPAAEGSPLHELLAQHLDAVVHVDNDVNLAAVGERTAGSATGCDDVVVLSLGTGVGAGIISGGRLLRGTRGLAAEVADLPLFGDPRDAAARRQGVLEQALGSDGLMRRFWSRTGDRGVSDVAELVARCPDDADAAAVIEELAERAATLVLALQAILDPQVVILTGGIGASALVAHRIRAACADLVGDLPAVRVSNLGPAAGLYGAASLARGRTPPWATGRPRRGSNDATG